MQTARTWGLKTHGNSVTEHSGSVPYFNWETCSLGEVCELSRFKSLKAFKLAQLLRKARWSLWGRVAAQRDGTRRRVGWGGVGWGGVG